MNSADFHNEPFDSNTLTKLEIFELYAKAWLPVFLSKPNPPWKSVHVYDFFAGPGTDTAGVWGSPLRLLRQFQTYRNLPGWSRVEKYVHLYDESAAKIKQLQQNIESNELQIDGLHFDISPGEFQKALAENRSVFTDGGAAKLAFIDQCGVREVDDEVFRTLARSPRCDFLFFISSSILNRFASHPAIKQKIKRPDDPYHVHRAVFDYYRELLPKNSEYFLAPFSIKKGANIYGLIFGSAHPLGIDKFLQVTWSKDEISGEANFDIHRDNIVKWQRRLAFVEPTKLAVFEAELEAAVLSGKVESELDVMRLCYTHGVKRQHSSGVLARLKKDGAISLDFRTPNVDNWRSPRPIKLLKN